MAGAVLVGVSVSERRCTWMRRIWLPPLRSGRVQKVRARTIV